MRAHANFSLVSVFAGWKPAVRTAAILATADGDLTTDERGWFPSGIGKLRLTSSKHWNDFFQPLEKLRKLHFVVVQVSGFYGSS